MFWKMFFALCGFVFCTRYEYTLEYNGAPLVVSYSDGRDFLFDRTEGQRLAAAKAIGEREEHVFIDGTKVIVDKTVRDLIRLKLLWRWSESYIDLSDEHVFTNKAKPTIKFATKREKLTGYLDVNNKYMMGIFLDKFLLKGSKYKLSISDADFYCKLSRDLTLREFLKVLDILEHISAPSDLLEHIETVKTFGLYQIKKRQWLDGKRRREDPFRPYSTLRSPYDDAMGGRTKTSPPRLRL